MEDLHSTIKRAEDIAKQFASLTAEQRNAELLVLKQADFVVYSIVRTKLANMQCSAEGSSTTHEAQQLLHPERRNWPAREFVAGDSVDPLDDPVISYTHDLVVNVTRGDLVMLGLALFAVAIPAAILLFKVGRPTWKQRWS